MQQIAILSHIVRRYRINISRRIIGIFVLYSLLIDSCNARGPHHPRSDKRRVQEQQHINEHLAFDSKYVTFALADLKNKPQIFNISKYFVFFIFFFIFTNFGRHIQEDLNAQQHELPNQKKVEDMSEEERNYMYFKIHDLDNNDKLDGLEIFYSATHHSASEDDHEQEKSHGSHEASGAHEDDNGPIANDNSSSSGVSNLKLLELDESGQIVDKNINHIIGSFKLNVLRVFQIIRLII